jgi:hypothetical protein
VILKTFSEGAAVYQGAGALNLEEFHNGNMTIEDFAGTKLHESDLVDKYQAMQTEITTKIITLEIMTHTPILTNSTTEITLDSNVHKTEKEIAKENKAVEKRIKKAAKEEEKQLEKLEKAEKKAAKEAQKATEK